MPTRDKDAVIALADAFDAVGYNVQFWTIAAAVNLYGGGTGIGISPREFSASLRARAQSIVDSQDGGTDGS